MIDLPTLQVCMNYVAQQNYQTGWLTATLAVGFLLLMMLAMISAQQQKKYKKFLHEQKMTDRYIAWEKANQ